MKTQTGTSNFNQAIWLTTSSFSSFALALVSAAILSRYFDKAEYGTYKQILYVYATLQTVFAAGLPSVFTYFIPRLSDGQGKKLVNGVNRLFILLGLAFSVFLYLSSDLIAGILKNPELSVGLKLFSPFPLFTIPSLGVEGIYTALRKTKYIAIYQTANRLLMLICIVVPVVVFKGTYRSAIIGWGIASFLTFIFAMVMKNRPYVKIKEELVPRMHKTIFNYSLPLVGASLVGMVLHSADQFFISRYYGQVVFADFSNGFIQIPFVGMIAGSVRSVLLPLFSKAESEGNLNEAFGTYNRAVFKSIKLIYPVVFFCLFFAGDIVVLLYGAQYEVSKSYLRASLIRGVADVFPYLSVLLALGKSNVYLFVHLVFAVLIWLVDFIIVSLLLPPVAIALSSSLIQVSIAVSIFLYIKIYHGITLVPIYLLKSMVIIGIHLSVIAGLLVIIREIFFPGSGPYLVLPLAGLLFYSTIIVTGKLIKVDYVGEIVDKLKGALK